MSESLRTDRTRAPDSVEASELEHGAKPDAKIDELLLVGLDHYFAGEYEHAINLWTRVLFLDRNHARARAYIERARSALAERQRHSEELLQNGVAAFERGDAVEARRLLQAAIAGGAPADEALAVLDRLDRLAVGRGSAPRGAGRADRTSSVRSPSQRLSRTLLPVVLFVAVACVCAAAYVAYGDNRIVSRAYAGLYDALPPPVRSSLPDRPLHMPRRGETALSRGRTLAAGGFLHDALELLETVRLTDPERPDADRLRAEIQRQLLAITPTPTPGPDGRQKGDLRLR
jgi:tetratricopeptide (TPR) repeat protein